MNKRYITWALGLLAIASLLTPVTAEARRYRGGRGYGRGYRYGYRYRPYRSYRYYRPYYGGYYGGYPYYSGFPGFGISFGF